LINLSHFPCQETKKKVSSSYLRFFDGQKIDFMAIEVHLNRMCDIITSFMLLLLMLYVFLFFLLCCLYFQFIFLLFLLSVAALKLYWSLWCHLVLLLSLFHSFFGIAHFSMDIESLVGNFWDFWGQDFKNCSIFSTIFPFNHTPLPLRMPLLITNEWSSKKYINN